MDEAPTPIRPGFCPYCGYDNPPEYRFCVSCRRRLPEIGGRARVPRAGAPEAASPESPTVSHPDSTPPADTEPPRPTTRGGAWFIVPVAVLIVVIVALASLYFFPTFLGGKPASTPAPPARGHILDLCTPDNGSNCRGALFTVPYTSNGVQMNTTSCDPVRSAGASELLWLNYSASAAIVSIVLPTTLFGGSAGWGVYAFSMVQNSSVLGQSLWFSHLAPGTFTESVPIPTGGATYCLGWWAPSLTPVSVQWQSDLNVTYQ